MRDDHELMWQKTGQAEFRGAYKTYLTKSFRLPNGKTADYDVTYLKHRSFAMALALTPALDVIVVRQYRPGPELIAFDMPAGMCDEGEQPEETMRRELREETGYEAGKLILLNEQGSIIGPYDDARGFFYLALDCEPKHELEPGDEEFIEVMVEPLKWFVNNALRKGIATHADCGWMAIDYMLQEKMITLDDIAKG